MKTSGNNSVQKQCDEIETKMPYEPPQILSREILEAMAASCGDANDPLNPGKADDVNCTQPGS